MKKNISLIVLLCSACTTSFFYSCVKDPGSKMDLSNLASFTIENPNGLKANSTKLYTVTFEVKDGETIENGKQVTISVSNGKLIDPLNLTNELTAITLTINNGIAKVFYRPESSPSNNIELIAKVDPFTFDKTVKTLAVEPSSIKFEHDVYSINKLSALDIAVFLKSDSGKVSSDLDVDFTYQTMAPNVAVINLTPTTGKTVQTVTDPFTKVLSKVQDISETSDTIFVFANYKNVLRDTAKIYFTN